MLPIKTILHPTDFSERSALAFRLACSLARDYGARLVVLHVVEHPTPLGVEGVMLPPPEMDLASLRQRLQELRPPAVVSVEHRLVEGNPVDEVLGVAIQLGCDLIVMGTHGRTGLGRALMGSVAEQVVRKARCPVLTVKAPVAAGAPASKLAAAAGIG